MVFDVCILFKIPPVPDSCCGLAGELGGQANEAKSVICDNNLLDLRRRVETERKPPTSLES